jgi:CheY-like chemotaxis protein
MSDLLRVLLVQDNPEEADLIAELLPEDGLLPLQVHSDKVLQLFR